MQNCSHDIKTVNLSLKVSMLSDYHCFGGFPFHSYSFSLTCRVPPKRRRTKGKVTCTRGWPDQPGWPPRAGPRGPTGAPCSTASPPPSSRTPPATTATSSSCNVFGTGQNLCYAGFFISQDVVHLRTTVGLLLVLSTVCSHTLLAISGPGCPYIHPETKLPCFFSDLVFFTSLATLHLFNLANVQKQ